jgi:di/tricarboxylate transporter
MMLAYWKELFGVQVTYFGWMKTVYPIILLEVPLVAFFLYRSFIPEIKDLSPTGFVTVISSSFVYITSVASPACNIMYGSGCLKRTDFLKGAGNSSSFRS